MSNELVVIKVRGVATGGEAVGEVESVRSPSDERLLGITAFVNFAVPGEKVLARVVEEKSNFLRCHLEEVLEYSLNRTAPECEYFGNCGGCELQHINYETSLEVKYQMVLGALRAGKIPNLVIETLSSIERSKPYRYRRRIQLHIDSSGSLGFYRAGSRSLIVINSCKIATESVEALIPKIKDLAPLIKGKCNSIDIEEDSKGVLVVFNSPYELSDKELDDLHLVLRKKLDRYLVISGNRTSEGVGSPYLELPLSSTSSPKFKLPGGAFSQVNWEVNLKLIEFVSSCFVSSSTMPVFDLYAGAGNFTFPIARKGRDVVAVECDKRLVSCARDTASKLGLSNKVSYYEESVESYLKKNKEQKLKGDVIVDPPRSGLGPVAKAITFADKIVLVSCQLPSFVRDLRNLIELGYNVTKIKPFDMFPQTAYIETVAVLEK